MQTTAFLLSHAAVIRAYPADLRARAGGYFVQLVARAVTWALKQSAIADAITDNLEIDARCVQDLDVSVELFVERAFETFEMDADNVRGLDRAIADAVQEHVGHMDIDSIVEDVLRELRARLR